MQIDLDLSSVTLGEWADIEDATGVPLAGVDLARPPVRITAGLIWITRRREDPAFTYDQALALKFTDVRFSRRARRGAVADPKARAGVPAA